MFEFEPRAINLTTGPHGLWGDDCDRISTLKGHEKLGFSVKNWVLFHCNRLINGPYDLIVKISSFK